MNAVKPKPSTPPEARKPSKEKLVGVVVSDRMNKSRVIQVWRYAQHKRYGKFLRLKKRVMAHDEKNETHVNDRVEITECRPMSARKFYRISKVLEKRASS